MIKRILYQDINWEKYQHCIATAEQYKVYAEPFYLKLSGGKDWELLVYGDYQAVMPIYCPKFFGVKLVRRPKLTQQLGVFSFQDDAEINALFLRYLQKKYHVEYYAFNDGNQLKEDLILRKNYILPQGDYAKTYAAYSPKRKRKIRLNDDVKDDCRKNYVTDFSQARAFITQHAMGYKPEAMGKYIDDLERLQQAGFLVIRAFYYQNNLINVNCVAQMPQAAILLGTFNNAAFAKINGASVLLDWAIKENIEQRLFDFEGSDLPNVEAFFTGFRPELKAYKTIANTKINILKHFFCGLFK